MGGICSNDNNVNNIESNLTRYGNDVKKGDDGETYVIQKKFVKLNIYFLINNKHNNVFVFLIKLFLVRENFKQ